MNTAYSARPHMFRDDPLRFFVGVLLIPVFGLGLLVLIPWWLDCLTTAFELSGEKVYFSRGIFSKNRCELDRSRIKSVRVHQTLLQRLTGVGDILIYTAGDKPEIVARGMRAPNELRAMLA
jgi:uncharacterized membrane protein YdbT with pleckstrin-like domain